jgi:SAM-dependent methyltransferase
VRPSRSVEDIPLSVERAIRCLQIDVATAELVTRLRERGIRSILLKGPALSSWLYKHDGARSYIDCDLLVRPDDFATVEEMLRGSGFNLFGIQAIPGDWPRHARTWLRADGFDVDLHSTLFGVTASPADTWDELAADTELLRVGGVETEILRPVARALVVALHAAKDGGRESKPCEDLRRAIERLSVEDWQATAQLARRLGAVQAFSMGLSRVPEGRELVTTLGVQAGTSTALALRRRGAPPLSAGLDWMLTSPGTKGKIKLVARKLFPPVAFLRAWSPIARRGWLGLAAAYAWRPLWVLLRTGPALFAWAQARSEALQEGITSGNRVAPGEGTKPPPTLAYVCRQDFLIERCAAQSVLHMGFLAETERPLQERLELVAAPHSLNSRIQAVASTVVGIDLSDEAIAYLEQHGMNDVYAADVERLSDSNIPRSLRFSVVLAGDIIEHLSSPGRMLEEVKPFLEPSGQMIVTTPNCFGLPNFLRFLLGRYREGSDHVQSYSQFTLANLLCRHGWRVSEVYTGYQERAESANGRVLFNLVRRFLSRFPQFGGTLIFVCDPVHE